MQDVRSRVARRFVEEHESSTLGSYTRETQTISPLIKASRWKGGQSVGRAALRTAWTLPFGWACRPKQGQGFGERYARREPWITIAEDMFMAGEKDKGNKSSPGEMHEAMLQRAVDIKRFDTPSLEEVAKLISDFFANRKKNKPCRGTASGGAPAGRGARG